ncbi:MAG: hybrid sensor histidine kinase/response regulator, partial [Planctomycetota bacterium]
MNEQRKGDLPLRARAESLIKSGAPVPMHPDHASLLQELHVHQIELDLQIDELRAAQLASEQARDRYQQLFDLAPVGYIALDEDGRIEEANSAAITLLGEAPRLLQTPLAAFLSEADADAFHLAKERARETGARQVLEVAMVSAGARTKPVRVEVVTAPGAPRFLVALVDLSDRLGLLAGGVAHDFNNLLTGILADASLALNEVAKTDFLFEPLENIVCSARLAADLTKQLLIYAGRGDLELQAVDVSAEVERVVRLVETIRPGGPEVRTDLAPGMPRTLLDRSQLSQVVLNLVLNALDAIDGPGEVMVRARVRELDGRPRSGRCFGVPELEAGSYISVSVSDNGVGMDESTMSRVFDPFFTTKPAGRGLGLAAAVGVVRVHGGVIVVESQLGRGSTFEVLLPIRPGDPAAPPAPERKPAPVVGGTLLLVDDKQLVRDAAARALKRHGYEVLQACDGVEALELFQAHAEEVKGVILDLIMPRMGGEETLDHLRALRPDLPVLLSSGYYESKAGQVVADDARVEFLAKPYTVAQLLAA